MIKITQEKLNVFLALAVISAGVLIISNIVAVKIWDFCGIPVDGGIAIFPLTYIIGDVVVELYGKKHANMVLYMGFILNILAVLIFLFVGNLPAYPGWENQDAWDKILGFAPRIVAGSLIAYIVSGLINNKIFVMIKKKTGEGKLWLRSIGSSAIAKIFDTVIFKTIAFLGVLTFPEFLEQLVFAYVASVFLEIILTPLTYFIVGRLKKYEFSDSKDLA